MSIRNCPSWLRNVSYLCAVSSLSVLSTNCGLGGSSETPKEYLGQAQSEVGEERRLREEWPGLKWCDMGADGSVYVQNWNQCIQVWCSRISDGSCYVRRGAVSYTVLGPWFDSHCSHKHECG